MVMKIGSEHHIDLDVSANFRYANASQ